MKNTYNAYNYEDHNKGEYKLLCYLCTLKAPPRFITGGLLDRQAINLSLDDNAFTTYFSEGVEMVTIKCNVCKEILIQEEMPNE